MTIVFKIIDGDVYEIPFGYGFTKFAALRSIYRYFGVRREDLEYIKISD